MAVLDIEQGRFCNLIASFEMLWLPCDRLGAAVAEVLVLTLLASDEDVVPADPGLEVTHEDQHVVAWD